MEIKLKNVTCHNHESQLNKLNVNIPLGQLVGVNGPNNSLLLEYMDGLVDGKGDFFLGTTKRITENEKEINRKISYVTKNLEEDIYATTLEEHIRFLISYYYIPVKDLLKKMKQSLEIVGLNENYLQKNMKELSSSEKKRVQIAIHLLSNPKVLLLDEPMLYLDTANQKKLLRLFKKLKEKYHKSIIIATNDNDFIFENTDYVIILDEKNLVVEGKSQEVFKDVQNLINNQIDIPKLVKFTYIAKQKNINLNYHHDIRDLIKDIYKHVDLG